MSLSLDIAERAVSVGWQDLPPDARHAARLCLADGIAVMLGASRFEPAVEPFQELARQGGTGPATLLAGGRVPVSFAALANGALSHALDFEDTYDKAGLHVNAAIIPTVLALAEAEEGTLGEALTAMAVGADFACRIGLSLPGDPDKRGWYYPPMVGVFGATLAGARLLDLTPAQTVAALSLAQVQFALTDALKRSPQSDLRAIRDGFAARAAVDSVLLARAGVTGTGDPLAEEGGLVHTLTGAAPDTAPFKAFGTEFLIADLTLKRWPCCRGTHPAIALALALREDGVAGKDLQNVSFVVEPPDGMLFEPRDQRILPATAIAAKFSIPFCFAYTMLHGAPGLQAFFDDARSDPQVLALAAKIHLDRCETGAKTEARLTFADGRGRSRPLPQPPSLRAGGATFADIGPKLRDCVGTMQKLNVLQSLETADPTLPVASLMASLGAAPTT